MGWLHASCDCCGDSDCTRCTIPLQITATVAGHTYPSCCETKLNGGGASVYMEILDAFDFNGSYTLTNEANNCTNSPQGCSWSYRETAAFQWKQHATGACSGGAALDIDLYIVTYLLEDKGTGNLYWRTNAFVVDPNGINNFAFLWFHNESTPVAACASLKNVTQTNDEAGCGGTVAAGSTDPCTISGGLAPGDLYSINNGNGTLNLNW